MNGHLLNTLGAGHPSLDTVHSVARRHHLHVKLTGAGGGGCAFAIIPPCELFIDIDPVQTCYIKESGRISMTLINTKMEQLCTFPQ